MKDEALIKLFGDQIVAQMKLGKSYQQAYSNVIGQAIAEKLIEDLYSLVKKS